MTGVYIDVETGGLDPNSHAITQVSAVAFDICKDEQEQLLGIVAADGTASILGVFKTWVHPAPWMGISIESMKLQGVTLGQLNDAPGESIVYDNLIEFIKKYLGTDPSNWNGRIWAHSAEFDHGFLRAMELRVKSPNFMDYFGDRCNWSCTKKLWATLRFLGIHNVAKTHLKDIACYYDIDNSNHHDAESDALTGIQILGRMLNDLFETYIRRVI
jgi:DNA polymerase III epsilon subunit-like protein